MTRTKIAPVIIHLKELPDEGQTYSFTQEHHEMKAALVDLVQDNAFEIQINFLPSGGVYLLSGFIKAKMNLACYRCAIDFKFDVNERINEILVIEEERPRGSHSARVNHSSELQQDAPSVSSIPTGIFNIGPLIHEIIALAEPIQPKARVDCDDSCENLKEAYEKGWLTGSVEEDSNGSQSPNPFTVLKDLKLNR